jgi:hypothetical protein
MKNVIILGASGNIATHVIDILVKRNDINLTLFCDPPGLPMMMKWIMKQPERENLGINKPIATSSRMYKSAG